MIKPTSSWKRSGWRSEGVAATEPRSPERARQGESCGARKMAFRWKRRGNRDVEKPKTRNHRRFPSHTDVPGDFDWLGATAEIRWYATHRAARRSGLLQRPPGSCHGRPGLLDEQQHL